MKINLNKREAFEDRHNGPSPQEIDAMLSTIGVASIDQLIDETVPTNIRLKSVLNLPEPKTEYDYINDLKQVAAKNVIAKNFIGQGYYGTIVPAVIQRNILENPGWYTAYTPYQAEIAQGRLEALINYQTLVTDLTGMEIANASLLDEGTAAAEAISMFAGLRKGNKKNANRVLVDYRIFPQTLDVMKTRAIPVGIELDIVDLTTADLTQPDVFAVFFQYPDDFGGVHNWSSFVHTAKELGLFIGVAADLLSLTILTAPGSWGVDVVVGTTQRLGVPMGFGGPHAAYFATADAYKRSIPGRIIGVSKDSDGHVAYRMALQTREQHIKRERATSNICTAQVLLSVMASMYAVYHGPVGLRNIAFRIHALAIAANQQLGQMGIQQLNTRFFDTLHVKVSDIEKVKAVAEEQSVNFRYHTDGTIGISFDQTHDSDDVDQVMSIIAKAEGKSITPVQAAVDLTSDNYREMDYLHHEVFNSYQAEHEMLRYIKRLENKDLSLVHSMISLGSCTMKLNATTEMVPVTWPEFGSIHPFAPKHQTAGYQQLLDELQAWLMEITGFDAVSLQPNSGAQGEYAGLMVIRAYHLANGDQERNVALIPSSAHGTNPASAVMAGMEVVIVACDSNGNIDVSDLKTKADQYRDRLSALMVTYPSTHGVFEESIIEICQIIHENGGLVYMDGANMNAQVGLTSPAMIGADVCHLNLHKTFCIPHGGGGPGMGPIGVNSKLAPYLPYIGEKAISSISAAPHGSASILPISHAYIAMMGGSGLTQATRVAILNANYIATRLESHYPILYKGSKGRNAHELIIDCRDFKKAGVEVEDIAKRLMDYGYHAPTVSFPVAGTMMIEPTESETKAELDRFCDVMISIRAEIAEIERGESDQQINVLKNAPHTYRKVVATNWALPYTREKAAFPMAHLRENKFWPSVSRIDSAYGDRNLMCSCVPTEAYATMEDVSA